MTPAERLRRLHEETRPGRALVLPGPWDAASAVAFAEAGHAALATPSHGVSAALGYADGACPAGEMFAAVGRIVRAVADREVPVSADIERGYGLPPAEIVERLLATGAVGCNLEDTGPDGRLVDPERQAEWLAQVRTAAGPDVLYLNARVDSYLRGAADPLADALARARRYVAAGADCVYPLGAPTDDLRVLAAQLPVPVNAVSDAGSPAPGELAAAGARRVTFGGSLALRSFREVAALARGLKET